MDPLDRMETDLDLPCQGEPAIYQKQGIQHLTDIKKTHKPISLFTGKNEIPTAPFINFAFLLASFPCT